MKNDIYQGSLAVFLTAVETGSFTATADRLHFTQQAVSKCIRSLEKAVGEQLFIREKKGLIITDAGRQYADACRRYLSGLHETSAHLSHEKEIQVNSLRIAFSTRLSLSDGLMDALMCFQELNSGLSITGYQGDLMDALDTGTADLALLLTETPVFEKDMYTRELASVQEFITVSPLVEQARNAECLPKDIWGVPYLLDISCQSTRTEAIAAAKRRLKYWGLDPVCCEFFPNVHSVFSTLQIRRGFTISLDRFGVDGHIPDAPRFPLPAVQPPLRLCAVWKRSNENPFLLPLVEHFQKTFSS